MADFLCGVCHPGRSSYPALHDVGINAVRLDVPFPFEDESRAPSKALQSTAEWVKEMRAEGLTLVGITPYPIAFPEWEGPVGSEGWYGLVREAARFLGGFFAGDISIWESTNEMNVAAFRKPLRENQAGRFVVEGARGIKEASASLQVGANMGGFNEPAERLYREIYAADVAWDYVGADGYFGTWEQGGPHTWSEKFDWLNELVDLPVIVMEWGFSSRGDILSREIVDKGHIDPHEYGRWCWGWETPSGVLRGHTWENQAQYIEAAMEIIRARAVAEFYYCWADSTACSCGREGCPIEANWGLVDAVRDPKPSYRAMKRAIHG